MNEILKIILERNMSRQLINSSDIKKICNIIITKNKYTFIDKIELYSHNPHDKDCAGVHYDGNIFFFYETIIDMIYEYCEAFTSVYQIDGAKVDIYNYYFLNIIFHELAHVRQQYISHSKHGGMEKKIFKLFLDLSLNHRQFYKENYSDILIEVNANNVAAVNVNYLYSKLPKNFLTINDYNVYQSEMLNRMLYNNYDLLQEKEMIISPAERILLKLDDSNDNISSSLKINNEQYKKMIYCNNKNLTSYKRLMLGLPISYQEYAYMNLLNNGLKGDVKLNIVKKLQKKL